LVPTNVAAAGAKNSVLEQAAMAEIAPQGPHAAYPELALEARLPEVSAVCCDAVVDLS
jgi:hypothetical protein